MASLENLAREDWETLVRALRYYLNPGTGDGFSAFYRVRSMNEPSARKMLGLAEQILEETPKEG